MGPRRFEPAAGDASTRTAAKCLVLALIGGLVFAGVSAKAQVAVRGQRVYTMAGPVIEDGVVLVRDGKISAVGKATEIQVPEGFRQLEAAVVTPGLIDAHSVVGLSGYLNFAHDRDQLESSSPLQPELRAVDAYNARERLVEWVRSFGVTTLHTGHAPGELVSGQTMIVKTKGGSVEDALIRPVAAVAVTLDSSARKSDDKSPGTRGKMVAMMRSRLIQAQEYLARRERAAARGDPGRNGVTEEGAQASSIPEVPPRDLALETLGRVLRRELPLLVTANRAQDIANALRVAREFNLVLWLDGAAECYLLLDDIRRAGTPVFLHPTMARQVGDLENASFETAAKLRDSGIPFALQSGYESYVPKTRVVLYEAAVAAAHGLGFESALASITVEAARILGIGDRVGSLVVGRDGDLALYDGDPFEYTTHCVGVIIEGEVVSDERR